MTLFEKTIEEIIEREGEDVMRDIICNAIGKCENCPLFRTDCDNYEEAAELLKEEIDE